MPQPGTIRQQIMECLTSGRRSARDLAHLYAISERHVEDHLTHIARTVARMPDRRFTVEPPECMDCGFTFRERTRLTRPSRCPTCHSERITSPRFGIDLLDIHRKA
jgi:predicted Zn-ribbon and HTH transcriptional regulator